MQCKKAPLYSLATRKPNDSSQPLVSQVIITCENNKLSIFLAQETKVQSTKIISATPVLKIAKAKKPTDSRQHSAEHCQ